MGWKRKKDFDHGAFWDGYSEVWEREGDGDGVRHEGEGTVLGVEWADDARTRHVLERFTLPYLPEGGRALEIGPGGGKFSRVLAERGAELTLCDISPRMLERAQASCSPQPRTHLLSGAGLEGLPDDHFNLVLSFDVFIHLESEEVFRYFAEVNRVLRGHGHFVVHTSNFEARYGFHSFFRQLRDHQGQIGERYGGRMYPLTRGIMRRFAEHAGFVIQEEHANAEDRDLIYTLKKHRSAFFWIFATDPTLRERWEIAERMGGGDDWDVFAALELASGAERALLVAPADHPRFKGARAANLPEHHCLPRSHADATHAWIGHIAYDAHRGASLERLTEEGAELPGGLHSPGTMLLEALTGLEAAHEAGLVHGDLGPESLFVDIERNTLVIFGLVDPGAAGIDSPPATRKEDRRRLADLFDRLPTDDAAAAEAGAIAELLRQDGAATNAAIEARNRILAQTGS